MGNVIKLLSELWTGPAGPTGPRSLGHRPAIFCPELQNYSKMNKNKFSFFVNFLFDHQSENCMHNGFGSPGPTRKFDLS